MNRRKKNEEINIKIKQPKRHTNKKRKEKATSEQLKFIIKRLLLLRFGVLFVLKFVHCLCFRCTYQTLSSKCALRGVVCACAWAANFKPLLTSKMIQAVLMMLSSDLPFDIVVQLAAAAFVVVIVAFVVAVSLLPLLHWNWTMFKETATPTNLVYLSEEKKRVKKGNHAMRSIFCGFCMFFCCLCSCWFCSSTHFTHFFCIVFGHIEIRNTHEMPYYNAKTLLIG